MVQRPAERELWRNLCSNFKLPTIMGSCRMMGKLAICHTVDASGLVLTRTVWCSILPPPAAVIHLYHESSVLSSIKYWSSPAPSIKVVFIVLSDPTVLFTESSFKGEVETNESMGGYITKVLLSDFFWLFFNSVMNLPRMWSGCFLFFGSHIKGTTNIVKYVFDL